MDNTDADDEVSSPYINGWTHCISAREGWLNVCPKFKICLSFLALSVIVIVIKLTGYPRFIR
jgi:hypothetical protein